MPLLHTWSLGIEEQFYFVTPLLMLLFARGARPVAHLRALLIGITAVSLASAAWMVQKNRADCFYLLPYRAWELAIGGLLAVYPVAIRSRLLGNILSYAGLVMILGAVFLFTRNTLFPGLSALLPCTGAALVIIAGKSRLLSFKPVVGIGLISYSVYLWHWPLLVFLRLLKQEITAVPAWATVAAVVLSYLLGWLSWKYIETPFRRRAVWSRGRIFALSAVGMATLFSASFFCEKAGRTLGPRSPEAARILKYRESTNPLREQAFVIEPDVRHPYIYGDRAAHPAIALWGDSHADILAYPLHEVALKRHVSFRFYGLRHAPPLPGGLFGIDDDARRFASEYTDKVFELLLNDPDIRTVILAARWASYVEGLTGAYGPSEAGLDNAARVLDLPGRPPPSSQEVRSSFAALLSGTVEKLKKAGKRVVLVYPVPETAHNVPQTLAREVIRGRSPLDYRMPAEKVFYGRQQPVLAIFDALPEGPEMIRIKPHEVLVRDNCIRLMDENDVLYNDDQHLSIEGARFIMPLFNPVFDNHRSVAGAVAN
jgi:hypothetical protein